MSGRRLKNKMEKLSEGRDKPLRKESHQNVSTLDVDDTEIYPACLIIGSKAFTRRQFKKLHFLGDVDRLFYELRELV